VRCSIEERPGVLCLIPVTLELAAMSLIVAPKRIDETKYPALPKIDCKVLACAAVRHSKIPQDECNPSTAV
jgi:hypothetical protein